MLLHQEVKYPLSEAARIRDAELYLDRLKIMYGYDVLDHLHDRFTRNYEGGRPYVKTFQHTESWKDANQCLQLCDLLTGCIHQALTPSKNVHKLATRNHLATALKPFGVRSLDPGFWKSFAP